MKLKDFFLSLILLPIFFNCEKNRIDQNQSNPLIESLARHQLNLSQNPLEWKDEELEFIDVFADARIIGLGEASHGSKEFFEAKHRIFRYLVENFGFKVFAFEADFGESLYINDAIQESRTSDIKDLMLSKMHFWTWKTMEVQHLLEWMSENNRDKNDRDKIHYIGIDCQFNTYHPGLLKNYLEQTNAVFYDFAKEILDEAKEVSRISYENFNLTEYNDLLNKVNNLADSLSLNKDQLIFNSTPEEYHLYRQILNVLKQSLTVGYHSSKQVHDKNYRDEYMAENVEWILDYKKDCKIALWAHNGHVANNPQGGWMGSHLNSSLNEDYKIIGFSFSHGSFTAVGMGGEDNTGLKSHTLTKEPLLGTLNELFSRSKTSVFGVLIEDLISEAIWNNLFESELKMFSLGAVYNGNPEAYYSPIKKTYYNAIIYFDSTRASELLIN